MASLTTTGIFTSSCRFLNGVTSRCVTYSIESSTTTSLRILCGVPRLLREVFVRRTGIRKQDIQKMIVDCRTTSLLLRYIVDFCCVYFLCLMHCICNTLSFTSIMPMCKHALWNTKACFAPHFGTMNKQYFVQMFTKEITMLSSMISSRFFFH